MDHWDSKHVRRLKDFLAENDIYYSVEPLVSVAQGVRCGLEGPRGTSTDRRARRCEHTQESIGGEKGK